jgi:multicomponent Na+:H+ antiporter subunit C
MIWITATLAGFLFAIAAWLILHRSWLRILLGVMIITNAANLVVLSSSGDPRGKLPPITETGKPMVDPLPQALLLTAIVIGFAVLAFFLTLLYRILADSDGEDLWKLFEAD